MKKFIAWLAFAVCFGAANGAAAQTVESMCEQYGRRLTADVAPDAIMGSNEYRRVFFPARDECLRRGGPRFMPYGSAWTPFYVGGASAGNTGGGGTSPGNTGSGGNTGGGGSTGGSTGSGGNTGGGGSTGGGTGGGGSTGGGSPGTSPPPGPTPTPTGAGSGRESDEILAGATAGERAEGMQIYRACVNWAGIQTGARPPRGQDRGWLDRAAQSLSSCLRHSGASPDGRRLMSPPRPPRLGQIGLIIASDDNADVSGFGDTITVIGSNGGVRYIFSPWPPNYRPPSGSQVDACEPNCNSNGGGNNNTSVLPHSKWGAWEVDCYSRDPTNSDKCMMDMCLAYNPMMITECLHELARYLGKSVADLTKVLLAQVSTATLNKIAASGQQVTAKAADLVRQGIDNLTYNFKTDPVGAIMGPFKAAFDAANQFYSDPRNQPGAGGAYASTLPVVWREIIKQLLRTQSGQPTRAVDVTPDRMCRAKFAELRPFAPLQQPPDVEAKLVQLFVDACIEAAPSTASIQAAIRGVYVGCAKSVGNTVEDWSNLVNRCIESNVQRWVGPTMMSAAQGKEYASIWTAVLSTCSEREGMRWVGGNRGNAVPPPGVDSARALPTFKLALGRCIEEGVQSVHYR